MFYSSHDHCNNTIHPPIFASSHSSCSTTLLPGGPYHAYSSSPYNGCTSSTPSPAPGPSTGTLTPPAAPPVPLFVHRPRFACSPVQNACAHAAELDFRYYYYLCSLVVQSPLICLSSISFGRAALEPLPVASSCSRVDIWISSTPGAINARSNYPLPPRTPASQRRERLLIVLSDRPLFCYSSTQQLVKVTSSHSRHFSLPFYCRHRSIARSKASSYKRSVSSLPASIYLWPTPILTTLTIDIDIDICNDQRHQRSHQPCLSPQHPPRLRMPPLWSTSSTSTSPKKWSLTSHTRRLR